MIEKLPTSAPFGVQNDWRDKINELVDAVNELAYTINDHKCQLNNHLCRLLALEDPDEPDDETSAENVQKDTRSRSENVQKPISLLDIHNQISEMYSVLWNKIEDIMCELVHFQEEINPAEADAESGQVDVLKWVQGKDYKPEVKENHKIRSTNERLRVELKTCYLLILHWQNQLEGCSPNTIGATLYEQMDKQTDYLRQFLTKGGKDGL